MDTVEFGYKQFITRKGIRNVRIEDRWGGMTIEHADIPTLIEALNAHMDKLPPR